MEGSETVRRTGQPEYTVQPHRKLCWSELLSFLHLSLDNQFFIIVMRVKPRASRDYDLRTEMPKGVRFYVLDRRETG